MTKTLTSAALIGDFDPTFPELGETGPDDDRVPGRDLAEFVLSGLRDRGFEVHGPYYEEPFLELCCVSGNRKFQILCWINEPKDEDPVWAVDCPRTLGMIARLFGQSEEEDIARIVLALHEHFSTSQRIRRVRWFDEFIPPGAMDTGEGYGHPQGKI